METDQSFALIKRLQILDALLHFETKATQRPNSEIFDVAVKNRGGIDEIASKWGSTIGAVEESFRLPFQYVCSTVPLRNRGVKGDWGRISRPQILHFWPLWNLGEGWAKCPSEFYHMIKPLIYFNWLGAAQPSGTLERGRRRSTAAF